MAKQSNSAKGQYYKARTKRWLEAEGFTVAHLERVHLLHRGRGVAPLPVKKDQLGSDLLAVSRDRVVFVQVKFFGTDDKRNDLHIRNALAEFATHPCPRFAEQWVVVWRRGERAPRVIARDSQLRGPNPDANLEYVVTGCRLAGEEGSSR